MSEALDPREATYVGRRTDGTIIKRPMSPHLQAYDMLQMSSATSITHRITGGAWAVGTLVFVWWLAALAAGPESFANVQWFLSSFLGILFLFGLTAVAWYHTLNGIRHLNWDAGRGFDLPTMYRSGRAVVIGTGVMTVLTWFIGIIAW
ncbi:succinate dehydrogenase, cytochrome b556 subunit [Rhodovarius crocodyli]|uniref:Succinate dehydrogenase cytochrome b556 subunit n=1 Tax=Rhodovarius crocodyli TaxID=1979269 RepID=A0A437MGK9_9PROT|nr:succinate dehydrogenase, cytochrome b556 subunit [Rhodovarius crocodyli]RVT96781.1 succinate dehydrogenase, cytochrome b556 subunit [Rhodovarius crocodyli]